MDRDLFSPTDSDSRGQRAFLANKLGFTWTEGFSRQQTRIHADRDLFSSTKKISRQRTRILLSVPFLPRRTQIMVIDSKVRDPREGVCHKTDPSIIGLGGRRCWAVEPFVSEKCGRRHPGEEMVDEVAVNSAGEPLGGGRSVRPTDHGVVQDTLDLGPPRRDGVAPMESAA